MFLDNARAEQRRSMYIHLHVIGLSLIPTCMHILNKVQQARGSLKVVAKRMPDVSKRHEHRLFLVFLDTHMHEEHTSYCVKDYIKSKVFPTKI